MRNALALVVLLLSTLVVAVAGCGSSGSDGASTSTASGGSGGAGAASTGGMGGCILCGGEGGGTAGVLVVTPAMATLDVVDGALQTQQFTAELNGQDVSSMVTWVFDKPAMGGLSTAGLFSATGTQGGVGQVTALLNDLSGSALVTINVTINQNSAGLTPAEQAAFDTPSGPDPSLAIVYPLDQAVMPLRVLSPEFQWNGGAGGDVYRFRLTSQHITYTDYVTAPLPSSHTLGQTQWEDIQFSGLGPITDPLVFELTRKNGATVYEPKTLQVRIAQDFVYGSVYYWQLPDAGCTTGSNGQILRISPSSTMTEEFFQPGVCWGCHTVSRDGTTLAAEFNDGNGPLYTLDLSQNPVNYGTINPSSPAGNYIFSAFNESGTKLLASDNTAFSPGAATLKIIDVATGATVNANAMGNGCGEPAWSPDGQKVAAICNLSGGGWTFDASGGNLSVADVNAAQDGVMNQAVIVPQAGGVGRPAYPSFSPDSQHIAFGRPTVGSRSTGNGKLWLVGTDGSSPKELNIASSDNRSFNPVFAPKSSGGYKWVVFISRRDYGNKMVNMNRQQLWVTAISDPPTEADPSHPPFYLRGQNMNCKSENAYYALDPCKEDGEGCDHGVECCNKSCVYDANLGMNVCGTLDPGECIPTGSGVCTADVDCCDVTTGVTCKNGFCEPPAPK